MAESAYVSIRRIRQHTSAYVALCCGEHVLWPGAVSAYLRTYVTHALKVSVARACVPALSSSLALNRSTVDTCTLCCGVSSAERSSTRSSSSPRARLHSAAAPLGVRISYSFRQIFTHLSFTTDARSSVHAVQSPPEAVRARPPPPSRAASRRT